MTLTFDAAGTGRPVVLVHGAFSNRRIWGYQLLDLSRSAKVLAVDLPGFGASPFAPDRPWLDQAVDGLTELVDELGNAPVLVGWSLGGLVVAAASRRYGGIPTVLVGTSAHALGEDASTFLRRRLVGDFPRMCGTMVREYTFRSTSVETEAWLRSLAFGSGAHIHVRALCDTQVAASDLVDGDVIVMHGRHDRVVPFEDRIRDGIQVTFDESGHVPFIEEKDRFGISLREVLEL